MTRYLVDGKAPGQFRATCRRAVWIPLSEMLALPREAQPDLTTTRWDKKLKCEVAAIQCDLDTDDSQVYAAHIKTVHGTRQVNGHNEPFVRSVDTPWRYPAPGMGLKPDGKPFKASTKDLERVVRTCSTCGLVAEVDDRAANVLWWDEHTRGCALAQAAS